MDQTSGSGTDGGSYMTGSCGDSWVLGYLGCPPDSAPQLPFRRKCEKWTSYQNLITLIDANGKEIAYWRVFNMDGGRLSYPRGTVKAGHVVKGTFRRLHG